jgi:hypothetical protein
MQEADTITIRIDGDTTGEAFDTIKHTVDMSAHELLSYAYSMDGSSEIVYRRRGGIESVRKDIKDVAEVNEEWKNEPAFKRKNIT